VRKRGLTVFYCIISILLPFLLTGCFVLNLFFPLPGKSERNVSVFLHYKNLSLENHEMVSVELYFTTVQFGAKTVGVNKTFTLSLTPSRQTQSLTDFFSNENISLAQYTFLESEADMATPSLSFSCGTEATVTYMTYVEGAFGGEGTTEATSIVFNLTKTTFSAPVMQLSSAAFRNYSSITLPGGQSRLVLLLNLKSIPTLQALKAESGRSFSLEGSISMVSRDLCFIYGTVSDNSSAETLVRGQYWTVDFDELSGLVFEDYYWGFGTYPIEGSLKNHRYFFFAPQIPNQTYRAFFDLYIPGQSGSIGRKEFDVQDIDDFRLDLTIQQGN